MNHAEELIFEYASSLNITSGSDIVNATIATQKQERFHQRKRDRNAENAYRMEQCHLKGLQLA